MQFNSYIFILLFFPFVFLGYFSLNHFQKYKAASVFLLVMSLLFCGYANIYYPVIIMISILVNYGIASFLCKQANPCQKQLWLCLGIVLNAGTLLFLKYYNFFTENINLVFKTDLPLLRLILPLGISFYTFQQISYLVDSYRGQCEDYSLLEYSVYISFFPKLSQGPITYHSELIPQLKNPDNRKVNYENLCRGIYAFALGLAKKVLIADSFAKVVNLGYGDISALNTPSAALVMVCYSLQIYFDFSGYCDMAYGIGYMFNLKLPINFNSPYKAQSISEFWERWHMTLTRFFTKYVYIPLGGSRRGKVRTYLNILIVFLVSGLWHGANWTFILWGLMHGIMKVLERAAGSVFHPQNTKTLQTSLLTKMIGLIRVCFTFLLVTLGWSLFRADSIKDAGMLWMQLLHGGFGGIYQPITDQFQEIIEISFLYRAGFGGIINNHPWLPVTLFSFAALIGCFTMKNTQEKTESLVLSTRKLFVVVILLFWSILSLSEISEFLYTNF